MFTGRIWQIQVRHLSIDILPPFTSFSDPNICNVFHICSTRNDKIIDQPFLCPYPTVFKSSPSGKFSCAYPSNATDCQGKAFYYPMENSTRLEKNLSNENNESNNYRLPKNTLMVGECTKEGLYQDNIYCNAYHECTRNGEEEHYLCENQLLFNPESNICDYPINVACGGKRLLLFQSNILMPLSCRQRFTSSSIGFCQWNRNQFFDYYGLRHGTSSGMSIRCIECSRGR